MMGLNAISVWAADIDHVIARANVWVWLICLVCLSPAVWRLLHWRGLYLDPIWAVVSLLAINRLTFLLHAPLAFSHVTALILALTMAVLTVRYQRSDSPAKAR